MYGVLGSSEKFDITYLHTVTQYGEDRKSLGRQPTMESMHIGAANNFKRFRAGTREKPKKSFSMFLSFLSSPLMMGMSFWCTRIRFYINLSLNFLISFFRYMY